jgi:L-ascorbate metabolism protein UlaG (beta-lactamase superfamily)
MEPEQAALAAQLLGSVTVVPIHYDGFEIEPWYRPVANAIERFEAAAAGRGYEVRVLAAGESFEIPAPAVG